MLDIEGPICCLVMPLRKDPWGKKEALNDTLIFLSQNRNFGTPPKCSLIS